MKKRLYGNDLPLSIACSNHFCLTMLCHQFWKQQVLHICHIFCSDQFIRNMLDLNAKIRFVSLKKILCILFPIQSLFCTAVKQQLSLSGIKLYFSIYNACIIFFMFQHCCYLYLLKSEPMFLILGGVLTYLMNFLNYFIIKRLPAQYTIYKKTKLLLLFLKLENIVLLSCCMFVTLYYISINLAFYTQTCSLFCDKFFEVMICVKILPPLHIY